MKNTLQVFVAIILTFAPYVSEANKINITGIYSDVEVIGGDDLGGMELFVLLAKNQATDRSLKYSVFVQVFEGGFAPDTVVVPFEIHGDKFKFHLPNYFIYRNTTIEGIIKDDSIVIISNGKKRILKRGKSFWQ